jgi:hypothetical protein
MGRPCKTPDQWLAEYGESHQDETYEFIPWICVPVIFCRGLARTAVLPSPSVSGLRSAAASA